MICPNCGYEHELQSVLQPELNSSFEGRYLSGIVENFYSAHKFGTFTKAKYELFSYNLYSTPVYSAVTTIHSEEEMIEELKKMAPRRLDKIKGKISRFSIIKTVNGVPKTIFYQKEEKPMQV